MRRAAALAVAADVLTLGATGYAASTGGHRAGRARGAHGTDRSHRPARPTGPTGATGPRGPAGTAVACGYVHADGTFDPSRSLNLLASAIEGASVYCLRFVSATKNLVASVDAQFGGFVTVSIDPTTVATRAPSSSQANAVALTVVANGTGSARDFYVAATA